jgi:hypothetical protein
VTEFPIEIRRRIAATRHALTQARRARDDYLAGVHLGELESLARIAAEHGIAVDGVEELLAEHGLATPRHGVPVVVELPRDGDPQGARPAGEQLAG